MHLVLDQPPRLHATATGVDRPLPTSHVLAASFSGGGTRLAIASRTWLTVVQVPSGELVARIGEHEDEDGDTYEGVALNHEGSRLVATTVGGVRAAVWDVASGLPLTPLPRELLDTSPDGAGVVTREFRDVVADLSAGVEFRERAHHHGPVLVVAPDRRSVVIVRADEDGRAEEYLLPDGHPLFTGTTPVVAAAFSPDSRRLLLAGPGGTIELTPDRTAEAVLARARDHVFRPLPLRDRVSFALGSPAPP
jgi:hypothetical protein